MNAKLGLMGLTLAASLFLGGAAVWAEGGRSQGFAGNEDAAAALERAPEFLPGDETVRMIELAKPPARPPGEVRTIDTDALIKGLGAVGRGEDGTITRRDAPKSVIDSVRAAGPQPEAPVKVRKLEKKNGKSVFLPDERVRITSTKAYPFRAFGLLTMRYEGYSSSCSGTLIGDRYVLTAAHCLYDAPSREWASQVTFYPGRNGKSAPYGGFRGRTWYIPQGYTDAPTSPGDDWYDWPHMRYDIGLVVLHKDAGNSVGWVPYGHDSNLSVFEANIVGYPADKQSATMWRSSCSVDAVYGAPRFLETPCDTFGGTSGASTYDYEPSDKSRLILGINIAGGADINYSFRLDRTYSDWLGNLME